MADELSKVYEPKEIERLADQIWQKGILITPAYDNYNASLQYSRERKN